MSKKRKQFSNEELGIDPAREARIIRIVVGTMVVLLILGMLFMFFVLFYESAVYEEPQPEQPFMEFSAIHDPAVAHEAPWHA
jgi:flagellar basal body-associated protein FliL